MFAEDDFTEVEQRRAEWYPAVEQFVRAWAMVEKHGITGYLAIEAGPDDELHPLFIEALEIFTGRLSQLEHQERKDQAEKTRNRSRASQAGRPRGR